MTEPVFVVVWEFDIRAGAEEAFLEAYGVDGEWARLFRRGTGFLRVELARSIAGVAVCQEADDPWVVQWATGTGLDSRLRYALPAPSEARPAGL